MVSQKAKITRAHDPIDTFARIRTVADDVAQAIDFGDTLLANVGQHGFQRFEVCVNIANDGAQHKFLVGNARAENLPSESQVVNHKSGRGLRQALI